MLRRWWRRRRFNSEMMFQERVMGRPGTRPSGCGKAIRGEPCAADPCCRGRLRWRERERLVQYAEYVRSLYQPCRCRPDECSGGDGCQRASFDQEDSDFHRQSKALAAKCADDSENEPPPFTVEEPTCGLVCKYGDTDCRGGTRCLEPYQKSPFSKPLMEVPYEATRSFRIIEGLAIGASLLFIFGCLIVWTLS